MHIHWLYWYMKRCKVAKLGYGSYKVNARIILCLIHLQCTLYKTTSLCSELMCCELRFVYHVTFPNPEF